MFQLTVAHIRRGLATGVATAAFLAGMPVAAQEANGTETGAATSVGQDENEEVIVVVGTRRSLEDALATKRAATQIIDSISSEGIGRLPDLNLAESLQRVPGVQINRSASRRLGTVSIRGLPGDFSQTLINGQYLASPDVSNFSFGTVRSEVFNGIDVIKAQSADQQTGGLSGLINLRTGSAMNAQQGLTMTVDGTYEELTDKAAPGGAIAGAYQIIPDVLAIRGAVGYKKSIFRIDNFQLNTYERFAGGGTADASDDILRPRQVRLPNNLSRTESISASFGLEWRPSDTLTAEVLGFYSDYTGKTSQNEFLVESTINPQNAASNSIITNLSSPIASGDFGSTVSRVRIDNARIVADTRSADDYLVTKALTGKLSWANDGWTVGGTAHYTKATRSFYQNGYSVQQNSLPGAGNGLSVEIDTGSGRLRDAFFAINGVNGQLVDLSQAFGSPIAPTYREIRAVNTPGASFIGGFRMTDESEDELAFSIDIKREVEFGPVKAIRAGGIYRDKSQNQTNSLSTLFGIDTSLLSNDLYGYTNFFGGKPYMNGRAPGIDLSNYVEFDVRRLNELLRPPSSITLPADNPDTPVQDYFIGPDGFVNLRDSTSISQIYRNKQEIYGGYLMADFEQPLFGNVMLRGNVGLRYERSTRATVAQGGSDVLKFDYDNFLPAANAIIEFGDNLVLRTSYTETIRRPQVDSFAVLRSIAVDGTGTIVTTNLGAADLKPFRSENIDVSLEWYNRRGSSISILGFRKKVTDYAGTQRICPADGGGFGFGPLTLADGICRTTQATPGQGTQRDVVAGARVDINITSNQDSFTLEGFEVSVQQNLDFLPAPWNGFGGQVNYTNVSYKSAGSFRLGEISKHTVNVILYYEVPRFGVRAAYNYRSGYFLGSGGTQSGADRNVKARAQLDLSASLNLTDRLSLTADAFNVTNQQLIEFEGAQNRVRNYFEYGRTFTTGIRYRF